MYLIRLETKHQTTTFHRRAQRHSIQQINEDWAGGCTSIDEELSSVCSLEARAGKGDNVIEWAPLQERAYQDPRIIGGCT